MLTVYAIEESEIYGHGKRVVIWFSGCSLHCKGCINSHLWNKNSGEEYSVREIMSVIKSYDKTAGVTYIGGEPLEQGDDLILLSKEVIKSGKDIVLFTGYDLEELNEPQKKIVEMSTVIITGRYIEAFKNTNLLLRGSSNQKIIVRDRKYNHYYQNECKQVEIIVDDEKEIYMGFPDDFI